MSLGWPRYLRLETDPYSASQVPLHRPGKCCPQVRVKKNVSHGVESEVMFHE